MLTVVLLALLATGCMCFEKYIPAYGAEFANLPSQVRFPEYTITGDGWVQRFALLQDPSYGRGFGFYLHPRNPHEQNVGFHVGNMGEAKLMSVEFEFINSNECRLHLTFQADKGWAFVVTSKMYTEPLEEFEDDAERNAVYATGPAASETFLLGILAKKRTPILNTYQANSINIDIHWVEKILQKSPKAKNIGGQLKTYDAVPVIMADNVLNLLHTLQQKMYPRSLPSREMNDYERYLRKRYKDHGHSFYNYLCKRYEDEGSSSNYQRQRLPEIHEDDEE